ncbi:transcription factor kayak isoform X2 [Planococcus citri]|uniref:transcription factor kayak isoform X2 n=1 Tax=Planococcus citri TaxID=170843 RepID=UPI0031F80517
MTSITTRIGNLMIPKITAVSPGEFLLTSTTNSEVNSVSIIALDVLNCQPSRTTPTLTSVTPATMRSLDLDQTYLEGYQQDGESHQNQAGFVPPLVSSASVPTSLPSNVHDSVEGNGSRILNLVDMKTWQGGTATVSDVPSLIHMNPNSLSPPIPTPVLSMACENSNSSSSSPLSSHSGRRNTGGRRPNNEKGISPEEDERRRQRRERNKLAAARCRKRRLDHTNELQEETSELESKRQHLREEVEKLKREKEELQFVLESHLQQSHCRVRDSDSPVDIKPFVLNPLLETHMNSMVTKSTVVTSCEDTKLVYSSMGIPVSTDIKPVTTMSAPRPRPNSLPVSNTFIPKNNNNNNKNNMGFAEMAGIAITTPSNGLLNFDSLMDGGTGLTPTITSLIPSCSTQLRNSNVVDLSSPESLPNKLVSL